MNRAILWLNSVRIRALMLIWKWRFMIFERWEKWNECISLLIFVIWEILKKLWWKETNLFQNWHWRISFMKNYDKYWKFWLRIEISRFHLWKKIHFSNAHANSDEKFIFLVRIQIHKIKSDQKWHFHKWNEDRRKIRPMNSKNAFFTIRPQQQLWKTYARKQSLLSILSLRFRTFQSFWQSLVFLHFFWVFCDLKFRSFVFNKRKTMNPTNIISNSNSQNNNNNNNNGNINASISNGRPISTCTSNNFSLSIPPNTISMSVSDVPPQLPSSSDNNTNKLCSSLPIKSLHPVLPVLSV